MSSLSPTACSSLSLITLLLTIIVIAMSISGCCGMTGCNLFNMNYYYSNSYTVTVTGLSGYTGSDGFRILVPVPTLSGDPAYTREQVSAARLIFPPPVSVFADYTTVHESRLVNNTDWTASLVDTLHGPMIELSSVNTSLSDLMLIVGTTKEVQASDREKYASRKIEDQLLNPVSQEQAGSYTILANSSTFSVYSSYVFIDGVLTQRQGEIAGNLSVSAEYHELFAEGSVPAYRQSCQINESIPASVTGWIPVTVHLTQ